MTARPPTLTAAAAVQGAEAALVLGGTVFVVVSALTGHPARLGDSLALAGYGLLAGVALALVTVGLLRGSRWSRSPAVLSQVFAIVVGGYLVTSGRYGYGVPLILAALAALVLVFSVPSSRVLLGDGMPDGPRNGRGEG